jgi:hypothetical protein
MIEEVDMSKRVVFMSVILSVVFVASMAGAYPVDLRWVGTVQPGTSVDIHAGSLDITTIAGNFQIQLYDANGPTVLGFCVDSRYPYTDFQTYDLSPISSTSRYAAAAWVLDQYHAGSAASAAAQIAVWELVLDWGTKDFSTGTFSLSSTTDGYATLLADATAIYTAAMTAFNAPGGMDPNILSKYMFASNEGLGAGLQDFIVPAPIPAAAWLLGSGLLGLVVIRRRMKK